MSQSQLVTEVEGQDQGWDEVGRRIGPTLG